MRAYRAGVVLLRSHCSLLGSPARQARFSAPGGNAFESTQEWRKSGAALWWLVTSSQSIAFQMAWPTQHHLCYALLSSSELNATALTRGDLTTGTLVNALSAVLFFHEGGEARCHSASPVNVIDSVNKKEGDERVLLVLARCRLPSWGQALPTARPVWMDLRQKWAAVCWACYSFVFG